MDRIAIVSDIHGNLPAFHAVLEDIRLRGVQHIYCLGDLVGKGPHPAEAVDLTIAHCEVVLQGNWDDFIGKPTNQYELVWHQERLGDERIRYLSNLPFSIDFWMSGKYVRLFHASPVSVYTRIQPWDPVERRMMMFEDSELTGPTNHAQRPDVVGYGDVHNAYLQHLSGKMLFNAGSVGNPLEVAQASYAILEGVYGFREPMPFSVTLLRVPYNIEEAIQLAATEKMPLLEPYARELRTARYRGLSAL